MSLEVKKIVVGPLETNCYLVGISGRPGLVIDPGAERERLSGALTAVSFSSIVFVNTHGHFDHVGADSLKLKKGSSLFIHRLDEPFLAQAAEHRAFFLGGPADGETVAADGYLSEGDELEAGEGRFRVIHTPGHSPGGVCLVGQGLLLSGDTLFAGDIGRTDLEGGDAAAMRRSLARLLELPDRTVVYPGHGPVTTIGAERNMMTALSASSG